jgi:hypothetical protein
VYNIYTQLKTQLKKHYLIAAGLIIYLLFFISVAWTGWFDVFFSAAALHVGAKGIDFYQIPKGAWAFWHGGSLTGDPLANGSQYAKEYYSNGNVYHPFVTLTLGSLLTLFNPAQSPYIWLWSKLVLSLLVIAYFFWSFRTSKYIDFAVFILCTNFSIYLELAAWQFHFILNMLLLLLLIMLVKRRAPIWTGCIYCLGMLVKPLGVLFVPTLLFKGRWKIIVHGIWLFTICTIPFLFFGKGQYYTDNLLLNLSLSGTQGPNQIITFSALLHYTTHWPDFVYSALQNAALYLVVFLSMLRRIPIAKAAFLYIAYFLCFYEQVFEYQWSSLAYVLAVCVVTCPEFQTKLAHLCILLTCLPGCFLLLNRLHIDVQDQGYWGLMPGATAWEWMVVSKLVPLFLLLVVVVVADCKPIFRQIKAFWMTLRKVNDSTGLFGDEQEESENEPGVSNAAQISLSMAAESPQ